MKPALLLLLTCLACYGQANTEWRTFTSPDGGKSFDGQLTGYDEVNELVTVRTKSGATLQFSLDRVSDDDRDYVESRAEDLPVSVSLDVRFEKIMDRVSSSSSGGTRNATYESGYKILINNLSPTAYGDVEVDYIIVYRKDQVSGSGTNQISSGSESIELRANRRHEVVADGVRLSSYYKKGQAAAAGGGGCSTCPSSGGGTVTRSERSRDFLVGCVARVKINGEVVHTSATSPNVLRQYGDSFGSGSSAAND
jgi:hypothetical protein